MYSIIFSLLSYAGASYYINKYLSDFLEPGGPKTTAVMILASIVSYAVAFLIDAVFPGQAIHMF